MFAIFKTGGKQYKARVGDELRVEKLDAAVGDTVSFTPLMLVDGDKMEIGAPLLDKASVKASVKEVARGSKIIVFKKKRRQNYRRKNGHRQTYATIAVTDISK